MDYLLNLILILLILNIKNLFASWFDLNLFSYFSSYQYSCFHIEMNGDMSYFQAQSFVSHCSWLFPSGLCTIHIRIVWDSTLKGLLYESLNYYTEFSTFISRKSLAIFLCLLLLWWIIIDQSSSYCSTQQCLVTNYRYMKFLSLKLLMPPSMFVPVSIILWLDGIQLSWLTPHHGLGWQGVA